MPLASLLDADFPLRGPGYLDVARADYAIHAGIKVWLTDNLDVYEDGALLPKPRVVAALVVAAIRQVLHLLRGGARPCAGPAACQ